MALVQARTIESIPDKHGGAFSFSSRTKYVNPSNAIPGPVYDPRYTATKKRVQVFNFSKFGPRWNSADLKNGKSTLGPKYDIPSTIGKGRNASFGYHDEYQAKKAALKQYALMIQHCMSSKILGMGVISKNTLNMANA